MSQKGFLGFLQRGDRLLAGHGREINQELRKRLTFLQVIDEGLEWDSGADEHRSTPEDLRIAVDGSYCVHGSAPLRVQPMPRSFQVSTPGVELAPAAGPYPNRPVM